MPNNNRLSNGYNESEDDVWEPRDMPVTKTEPQVLLVLALMQLITTLVFSLALFFLFDLRESLSALLGGLIASLGSLYAAGRLFTAKQDSTAVKSLFRFYASTVIKISFTLMMVAVCVIVLKVSFLPFIVAYLIAAVLVNLMALLVTAKMVGNQ